MVLNYILVGCPCAADLFVLVFGGSRSGEVMIVICTFRSPSSLIAGAGLVKLETELVRRTARRAQVKQLKSEKLFPCSRGNLEDSYAWAGTTLSWPLSTSKDVLFLETPKTGTVLILLPEINDFLQNRQLGSRSISLCFETEQNTFLVNFPRSYSSAKLIHR